MHKILTIALLFCATQIFSQDTTSRSMDTVKLDGVTISAQRFPVPSVSAKLLTLDSSKYFAQETPTFFSSTPSVISQTDNGTPFGYSYFTLRGMGQTRINYTLNGLPLNDGEDLAAYTSNYTDLLSNLKSIQLIRGAGVSSNGASSYAGIVNMELRSPFEAYRTEFSGMYGSFNSYRGSMAFSTGEHSGFGFTARASFTGSDGFRYNSSGRSEAGFISAGWHNAQNLLRLNTIYGHTVNGQAWLPVPEGMNPRTNLLTTPPLKPQFDDFDQNITQLQYSHYFSSNVTVNASVYHVSIRGKYDFPLDTITLGDLQLKSNAFGGYANVKYSNKGLEFQAGFTGNYFRRSHIFALTDQLDQPFYNNYGGKRDLSGFTRFSYKQGILTVNADIQVRNAQFSYHGATLNKEFFNYTFFNGQGGIALDLGAISPYASYGRTTREPTRTDIFGNYDDVDTSTVALVNAVKPETVDDIEFGFKVRHDKVTGSINGYAMFFHNEILSTNQLNYLGILLRKNVEKSRRLGIEVDLTYTPIKYLKLINATNVSYNTVFLDGKSKTPLLTPLASSYTAIQGNYKGFSATFSYKLVSQMFLESSNDKAFTVPIYHLLDMSLSYEINKHFSVGLFVNNLLNRNWAVSGNVSYGADGMPLSRNYFYSAGTNAYGTATIRF